MICNLLNVISISSNHQDRVAGKQVDLLSLMGLWVSDLLNSYQSTQVFRTGHYSLLLEGVAGIWIWLCHNKIYLIPLRALQYSNVPPKDQWKFNNSLSNDAINCWWRRFVCHTESRLEYTVWSTIHEESITWDNLPNYYLSNQKTSVKQ